jgi:hypothetical protein
VCWSRIVFDDIHHQGRVVRNDDARLLHPAGEVYGAMDMAWAKLVGQIAQAYGK